MGNSLNSWTPKVYPNPFQTVFQVDNTEPTDIHVQLFDVLGKSLEKQTVPSFSKGSLGNNVGSGLYILSVEGEKGKYFVRVVKE